MEEKKLMLDYIKQYATPIPLPLSDILSEWQTNKENLFHLFGNQLIVKKPINIKNPIEKDELERVFFKKHKIFSIIKRIPLFIRDKLNFTTNLSIDEITINDKTFPAGTKIYKILKAYFPNEEEIKDFQLEYSKFLDNRTITGNLCLSIHPMDFFTSSDNNYDWHSCMSWQNKGEYNAGTLEMMNSPVVIIAYIEGKKPFYPCKDQRTWSNKKWRSYIIVDNDYLCVVRGYPYSSTTINNEVFKFLAELTNKKYGPTENFYKNKYNFETEIMYNDFDNSTNIHSIQFIRTPKKIKYGFGNVKCLCCGEYLTNEESQVVCPYCNENSEVCAECGCRVCADDVYWYEDTPYCSNCYNDLYFYCDTCGNDYSREEMIEAFAEFQYSSGRTTTESNYFCKNCAKNANLALINHKYYITYNTPTQLYYKPYNAHLIEKGDF